MSATKGEIVGYALDDIGYSGDYDAGLQARGLRTLDRMMYSWLNSGLDVGYLVDEDSSLTDESGLLFQYLEVVQMNLACRLADQLAVVGTPSYRSLSSKLYSDLFSTTPPEMLTNPFMPVGAGNTRGCGYARPFQTLGTDYDTDLMSDAGVDVVDDGGFVISLEDE